jgi:hypothetical protein
MFQILQKIAMHGGAQSNFDLQVDLMNFRSRTKVFLTRFPILPLMAETFENAPS